MALTVALVLSSATAALQETAEPLTVGIDTNVEGNSDSAIGSIDVCAELAAVGDSFTFDLVVMNVPEADLIAGFQFDIDYDPSVIRITDVVDVDAAGSVAPDNVTILSRIVSSGGFEFLRLSEDPPDEDGSFTASAIDATDDPFPPANHEAGDGVLARITAEAVGTGTSDLIIPGPLGGFDGNPDKIINGGMGGGRELHVGLLISGRVSVGEPCEAPPTPTIIDPPATPDTATDTPLPSGQTIPPGQTDPAGDGTPSPGQPGGDAGDSDDGGSDTLLVIGVIAGIWVVAGLASAAWYFLRRRRQGDTPTE